MKSKPNSAIEQFKAFIETKPALVWWIGSNGNLFCDAGGYRYCVARWQGHYSVARNGQEIAVAATADEAQAIVAREVQS